MYSLCPPSITVLERALESPLSKSRVERMLAALGTDLASVPIVADKDIPKLIEEQGWHDARLRQGRLGPHSDPAIVFSTLLFENAPAVAPILEACPAGTSSWLIRNLCGHGGRAVARENFTSSRGVCRARVQFDTIFGCPHGCQYCPGGKVAVVNTNVEEFIEKQVIPAAEAEPWQKVFMYNSALSDTPCFEPEYGMSKLLMDYYKTTPDQNYLIHTKSPNIDWMLDLDHQGHTIMLWSLTSDTAARIIEPRSGTPDERIEAARKCQQAGYPIRFKLKPIVPVKGWRDQYSRIIARMLDQTKPDSIGLFMLAWMGYEELASCIDQDLLDPKFAEAVRASADEMRGVTAGPFPHDARAEVYRFMIDEIRKHDADVPVFLCTETLEMWKQFGPRLGMNPGNYICGCGPQCRSGMVKVPQVLEPMEMRS